MHKLQGKHRDLGLNTGVGNTSKKRQFFRGVSEEEAGLTDVERGELWGGGI